MISCGITQLTNFIISVSGISLGMYPANEGCRYNVTTSLIGWAHIPRLIPENVLTWFFLAAPLEEVLQEELEFSKISSEQKESMLSILEEGRLLVQCIYGLVKVCSKSSALAMELLRSCTKPSACLYLLEWWTSWLCHCNVSDHQNPRKGCPLVCPWGPAFVGCLCQF